MTVRLIQVDAFTDQPFTGNPAAVALIDTTTGVDDTFRQALALEMNLSETAFPSRRADGDWDLRWFTPEEEVDMCGHATLATAHVLFGQSGDDDGELRFHTRSGVLTCRRGLDGNIVMDFPASPARPSAPIDGLDAALGAATTEVGVAFDIVAQVDDPDTVAQLEPDMGALAAIETRAVIATAAGDLDGGPADYVCRVFAPRVGIPEDPVTGSAQTILAPWWAERLGRKALAAHQCSPRGGRIGLRLLGDRVELTGQAVTVMDGHLTIG